MTYVKPRVQGMVTPLALKGSMRNRVKATIGVAMDDASRPEEPNPEHRIDIMCTHYTATGARYRVAHLGDTLIESARDPTFEACRVLLARGIVGTLVTYSPRSSVPRLRVDIEKGATLMTIDNANDGPRFGRYRPHPDSGKGE